MGVLKARVGEGWAEVAVGPTGPPGPSGPPGSGVAPIGSMFLFAGSAVPAGFLFCNGAAISRTAYSALFTVIGTAYGVGDGSSTFNVPDYRGRSPMGVNAPGQPLSAGLGEKYGFYDAATISHTHGINVWSGYVSSDHTHGFNVNTGGDDRNHTHGLPNQTFLRINPFAPQAYFEGGNPGWGVDQWTIGWENTGGFDTGHLHNVAGTTGGINQNHQHAINASSDPTGEGASNRNFHPVLSCHVIIRAVP